MGIYSYFNIITQHFGQDNMSHAIPVPEQEEKHAYKLPISHEGKTKLEKNGETRSSNELSSTYKACSPW